MTEPFSSSNQIPALDDRSSRQVRPGFALSGMRHFALLLAVLAFVTGLCWATARDPFRRVYFSIRAGPAPKADAIAVMPRRKDDFPVVIYAHGSGGRAVTSGRNARFMAELGLAGVTFDYSQTNQAAFDAQMHGLIDYIVRQSWARSNNVAWVANSLGAQRTLDFLARHPEHQPRVMVRLAGGWVEIGESGAQDTASSAGNRPGPAPSNRSESSSNAAGPSDPFVVWLLHGENDEVFPLADVRRVASALEQQGAQVRLTVIPAMPHAFGPDWQLALRRAAEFCSEHLGDTQPVPANTRPARWCYWLPLIILIVGALVLKGRHAAVASLRHGSRPLLAIAGLVCMWAATETAFRLVLPQTQTSPRTLALARSWLVPSGLRNDFDWLANDGDWQGQPVKALVECLELADYNRQVAGWAIEGETFRRYVLSPWIDPRPAAEDPMGAEGRAAPLNPRPSAHWRRPLWEACHPRIRRETDPESAARTVVRFLREHVTVTSDSSTSQGVLEDWTAGQTDAAGFERLYVAALRSVGIPTRLGADGRAEICDSAGRWIVAPRLPPF